MWIFMSEAFLSIVDKGGDGSTLLVRARRKGEIESVFPEAKVEVTPKNDYRYRARLDRGQVAQAIGDMVRSISYNNFKSTVMDRIRHDAYMEVWDAMYEYQNGQD